MAEAEPAGEPSLDPAYLLRAVRAFLAVAAEPHSEPGSQKPLQPEAQGALPAALRHSRSAACDL